MRANTKTQLLIWSLGGAVLCAAGFGVYLEWQRTGKAGPSIQERGAKSGTPSAEAQAEPSALRILAPGPVIGNTTGHVAEALGGSDLRYEWSIQGGKLEGNGFAQEATWSAGNEGDVTLTCKGTDSTGKTLVATARVQVQVTPELSRFEATRTALTVGTSAHLTWTGRGVKTLVLDPGGHDVLNFQGPGGFEVKPTETTTYALTATSAAGVTITRELTLKVVPRPAITSLKAERAPGSTVFMVIGEFSGGRAELREGGTVLASSETSPLQAQVSDRTSGASLSFVVTNEAGSTVTSTLSIPAQAK